MCDGAICYGHGLPDKRAVLGKPTWRFSYEEAVAWVKEGKDLPPGSIVEGTPAELTAWREFYIPVLEAKEKEVDETNPKDLKGIANASRRPGRKRNHAPDCDLCRQAIYHEKCRTGGVDETNPKDLIGIKKARLDLVPPALAISAAPAMELGARKYGPYNWRTKAVRLTVYLGAIDRHLAAYRDGQDLDPESGYTHLGHVAACLAIIADAKAIGKLIDDRPPAGGAAAMLEEQVATDGR